MDIIAYIIVVNVISFLISIVVDYVLFRIWHGYAHRIDKQKTEKQKKLDKELKRRGFDIKSTDL